MTVLGRLLAGSVAAAAGLVGGLAGSLATATPALALDPVNPVRVDLAGHPANSGFLVFVENDINIRSDESEGTMAAGGDFNIHSGYQVAAGSPPIFPTYTAPGDTVQTFLHVGGGIGWENDNAGVNIENGGYTKVADTTTYTAFDRDNNGASVNYRLVPAGKPYNTNPHIDGRVRQTPASIATPVPTSLIDIPSAFALYRDLAQQMSQCAATVALVDDRGEPIAQPFPANTRGRLTLTPGETNVLSLSAGDLRDLSEITFTNRPTASTPLIVNVSGTAYVGNTPNLAGISGSQAPYILWNFPDATNVRVTGGDSIEGTLYAPRATLTWVPTQNIEGNVIARNFNHGLLSRLGNLREVHDFPFSTTVSCAGTTPPAVPPRLTLVKKVVNEHGGTAEPGDWILAADGPGNLEGASGTTDVTGRDVPAGDYVLSERGPDGYRPGRWQCTGGTLDGDRLTLAAGDDVTCTIVNRDRPAQLTLVKHVVNDHGGTAAPEDWTLVADGPTALEGHSGGDRVTAVDVDAGRYELAERDGPDGYTSKGWSCTGADLRSGDVVVLGPGDHATCTVTNDDNPEGGSGGGSGGGSDEGSGSGGASGGTSGSGGTAGGESVGGGALPDAGSPVEPWFLGLAGALIVAGSGLILLSRTGGGRRR